MGSSTLFFSAAGRKKLDGFIREMEGTFPNRDTIYEYFVDSKQRAWMLWEDKLRGGWRYSKTDYSGPGCLGKISLGADGGTVRLITTGMNALGV